MDNLTHSLVGALLGQAGLKRRTGLAMPALIVGANLPDIDAGCVVWGVESLAMRRGLTHGPIAWVLLPLLLAAFLWWFDKWQGKRGTRPEGRLPVHFGWLYALSFLACLTHPALDWLNVYGIRLLEPFSHRWFYGDTLFIIDAWLWVAMGLGLALSLSQEKRDANWRRPARGALLVLLAYVGLNFGISRNEQAHGHLLAQIKGFKSGEAEVVASPVPLAFWHRDLMFGTKGRWFLVQSISSDDVWTPSIVERECNISAVSEVSRTRQDLAAFLFWSRAPFAVPREGGGIVVHDARFYSPRTRDRFSVALPDVPCEPILP